MTKTFEGFAQNLESDYQNLIAPFIEGILYKGFKILHKETTIYTVQSCPYYFISIVYA